MNILGICENPDILKVMKLVVLFINIIKVVVPIILILTLMIKLVGAITKSNEDALANIKKTAPSNIIAAVLIFLVPTLVSIVTRISFPNSDYAKCIQGISGSTITESYETKAESLVKKAEETLKRVDYVSALTYLTNVKDPAKKEAFEKRLEEVNKKITSSTPTTPTPDDKPTLPVKGPLDDGVMVFEKDTDTLKVKIQKRKTTVNGTIANYYLTYIWAKDPYKQSSKAQAANYPNSLQRISEILNDEVKNENLQNKLVIAMNASAYNNNSYGGCLKAWEKTNKKNGNDECGENKKSCYCYYTKCSDEEYSKKYKNTQVGQLVITKGKVVRKWTSQGAVEKRMNLALYGIDSQGNFRVFTDAYGGNESAREKKFKEIIDSGIKDTITWYVPLILDGKTVGWKNNNSIANITAFCQIDRNNFVVFSARRAVNKHTATDDFEQLGCKNAVNFDGGGSVELLYKDRGGEITRIFDSYGDAANAEVFYFTE